MILYGAPASQPSRAVYWTCLLKELPFELRVPAGGPRGLALEELNPKRQVPTIVDGDFVLYEMPAILVFLCEKHGWPDLYPADLEMRARVNQYLHFHHSSTRLATFKLMAPHVTIAFGGVSGEGIDVILRESIRTAMSSPNVLEEGRKTVGSVAEMIERSYLNDGAPFLCASPRATIADIACYEELAQLRWAALFDFEGLPKLRRWLGAMAELPYHEPVHSYNVALGDIRTEPNTLERFVAASAVGVAALEKLGVHVAQ